MKAANSNLNVIHFECDQEKIKGAGTLDCTVQPRISIVENKPVAITLKWRCTSIQNGKQIMSFLSEDSFSFTGIDNMSIEKFKIILHASKNNVQDELNTRIIYKGDYPIEIPTDDIILAMYVDIGTRK